ncbi:MAG: twin-arginine translocase TatA/TatE family subunit [Alphaproteobacteria bacterium]
MGSFSIGHWLVVLAIVLILFGAGRLPQTMGDLAQGMRNFKKGMREDAPPIAVESTESPPADGPGSGVSRP